MREGTPPPAFQPPCCCCCRCRRRPGSASPGGLRSAVAATLAAAADAGGRSLQPRSMSPGSAAAPAAAAAAAAAAEGAEAAIPHRARRSPASSFLPRSAPPAYRAGRTPPRASGRAPFPAPCRRMTRAGTCSPRPRGIRRLLGLLSGAQVAPAALTPALPHARGLRAPPVETPGSSQRDRAAPRPGHAPGFASTSGCGPAPRPLISGRGLALTSITPASHPRSHLRARPFPRPCTHFWSGSFSESRGAYVVSKGIENIAPRQVAEPRKERERGWWLGKRESEREEGRRERRRNRDRERLAGI